MYCRGRGGQNIFDFQTPMRKKSKEINELHHWCAVSQQSDITSALLDIVCVEGSFATKLAMSIFPNVDIKTHTQTSHPQKQNKWLEIRVLEYKCKQKTTINPWWNIWIWRPSWHAQIYDYAEISSCMNLINFS